MSSGKPQWQKSCANCQCVEVFPAQDGNVLVRDSKDPDGPVLTFTAEEWEAFIEGVLAGQFTFRGAR